MQRLVPLFVCLITMTLTQTTPAAGKRPMTLDDMFKFKRVADPQISPDGKWVVYAVTVVADVAGNKTQSHLWIAPADGSQPARQLTTTEKKDSHPRWSPDGKQILFESTRSGSDQLWVIDIGGGEAKQLTQISTEAGTGIWSRDGKQIAFVSAVYPENSEKPFKESNELNKKRMDEVEKNPVKAKIHTRLFYRHWDSYVEDKRQHLFVISFDPQTMTAGEPKDVTPGDRDAYPTSTTFSVGDDFTFSPDGKFLLFTAVPPRGEAWSTNHDVCRVPVTGGTTNWESLTASNKAADTAPQFSPDGKKLAYRAQKKAGYEADKWDLMVVDVDADGTFKSSPKSVTSDRDRSVNDFVWAGNDLILYTADHEAGVSVFVTDLLSNGATSGGSMKGQNGSLSFANGRLAFTRAGLDHPNEVYVWTMPARNDAARPESIIEISKANESLRAELELPRPESVAIDVEGGVKMQMWILKPPGFDESKKWPVAYLVHGGPQGAWEDGWSFRWCPELWAAQGYIVALPNPRGSTGFGQQFVDEISGDWGGKCYRDLMAGVDYLEKLPFVDKDRVGAAGASFGGYMMDWFSVNTGRFKCLISHCSVWNFESMWGTTDELWFDEFEHGGLPWEKPGHYAEFSPHKKAGNLGKFKTPMLVIQNDMDFRCPVGQGIELFTALQRQGVKSRFINYPDEGHWVLKPGNSKFWHTEVFNWLKEHVPPGGK
jgi:dipeptidyl aminopeptidase/acylaminoacyl peptidase